MDNHVVIKNTSTAAVVISAPDLNFRREIAPSREVRLEKELYNDLLFDQGFQSLVGAGFISFVSGNEDVEDIKPIEATITKEEMKKIYSEKNYSKFQEIISNASPAAKDVICEVAKELKVMDNGFLQLIKKYCDGFDVENAIHFEHQLAEDNKEA